MAITKTHGTPIEETSIMLNLSRWFTWVNVLLVLVIVADQGESMPCLDPASIRINTVFPAVGIYIYIFIYIYLYFLEQRTRNFESTQHCGD